MVLEADGGYHRDMEDAFYPLRLMDSYRTLIKISGEKPQAEFYGDEHGHIRYRDLANGQFTTQERALEILSKQATG